MASSADTSEAHALHTSKSQQRLAAATTSVKYMLDPNAGPQPARFRTRAFLRTARYLAIFAFWRLLRYVKYAAVGALVAAVSGTVIGSVASGAAFVLAPTGILGGAGAGLIWAVAKFGWRRAQARMRHGGDDRAHAADPRKDERDEAEEDSARPNSYFAQTPW